MKKNGSAWWLCSLMLLVSVYGSPVYCQKIEAGPPRISSRQAYRHLGLPPEQQLVWLDTLLKPFFRQVVYQSPDNFTQKVLYPLEHRFMLVQAAAQRLKAVQDTLLAMGLNLLLFDTYRPWSVTNAMWEAVPDERYAANPANGSGHNRGVAIDLTLADARTGQPLPMPTAFDDFSEKAGHEYQGLPPVIATNRNLLKRLMEQAGFRALATEWWHYSLPGTAAWPIFDLSFEDLEDL